MFMSPRGGLLGVLEPRKVSGRPVVSSRESRAPVVGALALAVLRSDLPAVLSLARRKVEDRPGVSRIVSRTPADLTGVMTSAVS